MAATGPAQASRFWPRQDAPEAPGRAAQPVRERMDVPAGDDRHGPSDPVALRLQDRESGRALLLHGPVEGDALLSAIDLLAAGGVAQPPSKEMPAEPIGDMPR